MKLSFHFLIATCIPALLLSGCFTAVVHTPVTDTPETVALSLDSTTTPVETTTSLPEDSLDTNTAKSLSPASQLVIDACDNYLNVNPKSPKRNEVMTIMASLYYNAKLFDKSRSLYEKIIDKFPGTSGATDAMRMIAQTYYEEKNFTEAQLWYRKISESTPEGSDKQEILTRIAESIFRMAELHEENGRFKDAAESYERTALEFPDSRIADVALFNAGLAYEKQVDWTHAILTFQRLIQKYPQSKLVAKTQFRIARSYEKMLQWENAAQAYLRVVANFPRDELAPTAMYNAGFCFENADLQQEAAATFEKMAQLFPNSDDAADVLFRAGEIYGKIKDWESVGRVNKLFAWRYGNDQDRIIQVQCMMGIALYMQSNEQEAIQQLEKTLSIYTTLKEPSAMNTYYAAKAVYTIGEIHHESMKSITLPRNRPAYKKLLTEKSTLLDQAIQAYGKVLQFRLIEWTTRAVFQLGQVHEDFAVGIFKQERPLDQSLEDRIDLELGIAQAVEKYFVTKALHYHEQNVKLGLKENIEDKYVLQSRRKLTYLPYIAGENYLSLSEISRSMRQKEKQEGFALIARKLQLLQQIAPYQERAIDLLLKALEMGSTYHEMDDYYKKASTAITGTSFTVGETYSDIVTIARDAPIPQAFDAYESFVYKTKLIKQVEGYEDQALTHYLKTLKIAEAYSIDDDSSRKTKNKIAELLFYHARCYDLLCLTAFNTPPYPAKSNNVEREEFKLRFEEIGLKFQEQAFEIYRSILTYASQNYADGNFVTHGYVRLFQNFPDEFGVQTDEIMHTAISSGNQWLCATDSLPKWFISEFNDSSWSKAHAAGNLLLDTTVSFPGTPPSTMWFGDGAPDQISTYTPAKRVFFRRTFTTAQIPHAAILYLAAAGISSVYANGHYMKTDSASQAFLKPQTIDLMGKIHNGKNCIAIEVNRNDFVMYGIKPLILLTVGAKQFHPKPPGFQQMLPLDEVRIDVYKFPVLKNFELEIDSE